MTRPIVAQAPKMVNENGAAGLKLHALHQADYAVVRVKNALDENCKSTWRLGKEAR